MILRFIFLLLMLSPFRVMAEANPELWPYVKERLFQERVINEADFLTISGPRRASSGAQVPVTIKLDTPKNIEMKNVFLIIDANPTQLAATYQLSKHSQELDLSTRIRMETDSYVRVVGEDSNGKLYMNAIAIRASGGCSGYMDVHDPELTADLGKILIKNQDKFITTRIKHPNFTGLQRDLDSGGYIPRWIVEEIIYVINEEVLLVAKNRISMSQDPYLKFKINSGTKESINILVRDTKGNGFTKDISI
jgi:sulfur-oxidizing protein SoxY